MLQMNKLVAEIRCSMENAIQKKKQKDPNQPVYEYDSDEEVEGGTWEHKKRAEEMRATLGKLAGFLGGKIGGNICPFFSFFEELHVYWWQIGTTLKFTSSVYICREGIRID